MLLSAFLENITPIRLPAPIRIANLRAGVSLRGDSPLILLGPGVTIQCGRRHCGLLSPAWETISIEVDCSAVLRFCQKQCDGNDMSPNAYTACITVTGVDPLVWCGCLFGGRWGQGEGPWPGGQLRG